MAQPLRKAEEFPRDADEARAVKERYEREAPTETPTHGMERAPGGAMEVRPQPPRRSVNRDRWARIERPHKGDVGRSGTNEEIYQGSKGRELK